MQRSQEKVISSLGVYPSTGQAWQQPCMRTIKSGLKTAGCQGSCLGTQAAGTCDPVGSWLCTVGQKSLLRVGFGPSPSCQLVTRSLHRGSQSHGTILSVRHTLSGNLVISDPSKAPWGPTPNMALWASLTVPRLTSLSLKFCALATGNSWKLPKYRFPHV